MSSRRMRSVTSRPAEQDPVVGEANVEVLGDRGQPRFVVRRDARVERLQRHEAIERSAVELMEAKGLRHARRDRALARRGGAVDGDDRNTGDVHAVAIRANSAK